VKIGPLVSAEYILIEIALRVQSWFSIFHRISLDVLDQFSQPFNHMKALYVPMIDLYLIFQFVKEHSMAMLPL